MPKKKKKNRSTALDELAAKMMKMKADLKKVNRSCLDRTLSLIGHPNTKLVKMDGRGFRVRGRYYKGLIPVLKELFWPGTEEDPMKRSKEDVQRRKARKIYVPSDAKEKRRKCKGHGARHGSRVHKEVCKLVRRIASKTNVRTIPAKLDPCTIRVINTLAENEWFPIASELGTFDDVTEIATSMDIMVIGIRDSKVRAIELKTGYEGEEYGEHPTDPGMSHPLNKITDCPKNRHAMQHMCTLLNFRENYDFSFDDAVILRVCPKQQVTKIVPLPDWSRDISVHRLVLSRLLSHRR